MDQHLTNKQLAHRLGRALYHTTKRKSIIARYDYGLADNGSVRRAYKTDTLLSVYHQKQPAGILKKLTRRHLYENICGIKKYYYCSDSRFYCALIGIDIDAHSGQTDAKDVAAYLLDIFPDTYWEPSSRGQHGYLVIDKRIAGKSLDQQNELLYLFCRKFEHYLGHLIKSKGYESTVEIKGYPSFYEDRKKNIYKRGPLFRLPTLPDNQSSLNRFLDYNIYKLEQLQEMVMQSSVSMQKQIDCNCVDQTVRPKTTTATTLPLSNMGSGQLSDINNLSSLHPNGVNRKQWAVSFYAQERNKKPREEDVDLIYEIYLRHCKLGKSNEQQRKQQILYCIKTSTWTPCKTLIDPNKYIDKVTEIIPALEFNTYRLKYPDRPGIDHALISMFVSVLVHNSFYFAGLDGFRFGRDAVVNAFGEMKELGIIDRSLHRTAYAECLRLTNEYGLLNIYRDYTPPVRKLNGQKVYRGKVRIIGPGEQLAFEHAQFQQIWAEYVKRTGVKVA